MLSYIEGLSTVVSMSSKGSIEGRFFNPGVMAFVIPDACHPLRMMSFHFLQVLKKLENFNFRGNKLSRLGNFEKFRGMNKLSRK
jgi:hypothetical protein